MHHPPSIHRRSILAAALSLALPRPSVGAPRASGGPARPPAALVHLAGRCVLAGFHGRWGLPPILRARLAADGLAGVLVTSSNAGTLDQLVALARSIQSALPAGARPALVAADQEGGPVAHLSPPLPTSPGLTALGVVDDEVLTGKVGRSLGALVRGAGCNFDLAPVLDVRTCLENLVILGRVFGHRPDLVARHGVAFAAGLSSAGVLGCAKHFPGHGDTREDSHVALPRVAHGRDRLEDVELVPFRAAASVVPAMMLAHVVYAGVDPALPASLSPRVVQGILRESLGYDGVAVSDDLEMAPIRERWGVPNAAVLSIEAGCDLVLVAHTPTEALRAIDALATAAEARPAFLTRLTDAAGRVDRLRAVLANLPAPIAKPDDPVALMREVVTRSRGHAGVTGRDPTVRR